MKQLLQSIKHTFQITPDTVCPERARLVTEAWQIFDSDPIVLKRAKVFDYILQNISLDLDSNPFFAGNISSRPNAWMVFCEYSLDPPNQIMVEDTSLYPDFYRDNLPEDIVRYWDGQEAHYGDAGIGHFAVDMERVLSRGLLDVISEAEAAMAADDDTERNTYRQAMVISLRAVITWAERFAVAAWFRAQEADGPVLVRLYTRMSAACRQVPARPARNLYEALQTIILVHLAVQLEGHGWSVTPGRLDKQAAPYYKNDPDAVELIAGFLLKLKANPVWGGNGCAQTITLGGRDVDKDPSAVAVSRAALRAYDLVPVADPAIYVRWHDAMDPEVKRMSLAMLSRGLSMPLLSAEDETVRCLEAAGIASGDARDYCLIGCNELGVAGRLMYAPARLFSIKILTGMVHEPDADTRYPDMESFLAAFGDTCRATVRDIAVAKVEGLGWHARLRPTPFASSLIHGCIGSGADLHGNFTYNPVSVIDRGFTNTVNSLAVIRDLVYRQELLSLADLSAALRDDFQGHDVLLHRIAQVPRWGNDRPETDQWAVRWLEIRNQIKADVEKETGISLMYEHVVRSLHVVFGKEVGATPDGRRAGMPLADSVGAGGGNAVNGPTAMLNSVSKGPAAAYWTGGFNLNLTLPYSPGRMEENADALGKLTDTFFSQGGQQLQVNCLNREVLEDAQAYPDKYPDLMVRIAGFNELFVRLPKIEQDDVISRLGVSCGYGA